VAGRFLGRRRQLRQQARADSVPAYPGCQWSRRSRRTWAADL